MKNMNLLKLSKKIFFVFMLILCQVSIFAQSSENKAVIEREGLIQLHKGYHPVEIEFFQKYGGSELKLYIQDLKSNEKLVVPDKQLFHE